MELDFSWYIYKLRSGLLLIEPVIKGYNWGIPCPDRFKNLLYSIFPSPRHSGYIFGYMNYYKRYDRSKLSYNFGIGITYNMFSSFDIESHLCPSIDLTINNLLGSEHDCSVHVILSPVRNCLKPEKIVTLGVDPDIEDEDGIDFISRVKNDMYMNICCIGIGDFNTNLLDEVLYRDWVDRYMGSNTRLFYENLDEYSISFWSVDELDKINTLGEVFFRL